MVGDTASLNKLIVVVVVVVVVVLLSCVRLFVTSQAVATRLLCPWDFPGKNTGVDCLFLLWGIFLTQGSKPNLLTGGFFHTVPPFPAGIVGYRTGQALLCVYMLKHLERER